MTVATLWAEGQLPHMQAPHMAHWGHISSPSWAQQMILRYPGHHRVQMASSSWERKRCSSELDKAAAFLPSLVSSDYLGTSFQAVHGVLLFADISGRVRREEQL